MKFEKYQSMKTLSLIAFGLWSSAALSNEFTVKEFIATKTDFFGEKSFIYSGRDIATGEYFVKVIDSTTGKTLYRLSTNSGFKVDGKDVKLSQPEFAWDLQGENLVIYGHDSHKDLATFYYGKFGGPFKAYTFKSKDGWAMKARTLVMSGNGEKVAMSLMPDSPYIETPDLQSKLVVISGLFDGSPVVEPFENGVDRILDSTIGDISLDYTGNILAFAHQKKYPLNHGTVMRLGDGTAIGTLSTISPAVVSVYYKHVSPFGIEPYQLTYRLPVTDLQVTGSNGRVSTHDYAPVNHIELSFDGKFLYTTDYSGRSPVKIWDMYSTRLLHEREGVNTYGSDSGRGALAASKSNSYLAYGSIDGILGLIDLKNGRKYEINVGKKILNVSLNFSDTLLAYSTSLTYDPTNKLESYSDIGFVKVEEVIAKAEVQKPACHQKVGQYANPVSFDQSNNKCF